MEPKTYDIVSIGEILIDMTPHGLSPEGQPLFEANPGGAVANALAMAASLGSKCLLMSKVGDDSFGRMLLSAVKKAGLDPAGILTDPYIPTTLALVSLDENGERDFTFYRKPGADIMLRSDDIDFDAVAHARILHFGTLSLVDAPCKQATAACIEHARKNGCLVSFDPNIRMFLWEDKSALKHAIHYGLQNCDILKISDDELLYYTGKQELKEAVAALRSSYPDIRLVFVTCGAGGCLIYHSGGHMHIPGCLQENIVDTTGAGDSFMGTCLHYIAKAGLDPLAADDLADIAAYANAAASLVIGRKGAFSKMPCLPEIEAVLK